ncbi:HDOD domain-containing protein [Glaciecola sp. MF2-115]|uniref:HDOD domain-containing protein n=1 Tax=Glaciecola sp. MF2-115 TaxID=3384827 RepID=UPI00399F3765
MKLSVSQLASTMNSRFDHLLVSLDEAILLSGQKTEKQRIMEDSEQADARRELLFVEEVAIKNREEINQKQNLFIQQVEAEFHVSFINDLAEKIRDTDFVLKKILGYDPELGKLLDVLYTESCSISRLEASIIQMDWLQDAIIKFVKQPKYRRFDSKGKLIVINSLRSALSFVGIESLRTLLPALIAKRSLPPKSEVFPELQKHMWEYTLGTGKACKAIAEKESMKWYLGYNIGLLSTIGRSAIAKMYLRAFDAKLREKIIEARKNNNPVQAKALNTLVPSHKYLVSLWGTYSNQLTYDLVALFKCRWLMVGVGLEDYTRIKEVSITHVREKNLHPLTNLLFRCQGYMQFKMMKANGLMSKQTSMVYLRNFGIVSDDVVLLMKTNLTGIEIQIPEIQQAPKALND